MSEYFKPLLKILGGSLFVVGLGYGSCFIFKSSIKKQLLIEGSEITANIMNSKNVQHSVKKGVHDLISEVLTDNKFNEILLETTYSLVKQLSNNHDLKKNISEMLSHLLKNTDVISSLSKMLSELLQSEEIHTNLANMFVIIFSRDDILESINKLLSNSCNSEANKEEIKKVLKSILESDDFRKSATDALKHISWKTIFGMS